MARKNRTPEEKRATGENPVNELLQMANIGSMDDIQNLFKETIAEFMENGLEAELEDEPGYSRYDYRKKATDNSRNGHSGKTLRTSFGDVEVSIPRDRKGEFEPQILKKNQTSISQDIEEKILSMYAKGMTAGDIEAHIQDNLWHLRLRQHREPDHGQDSAHRTGVAAAAAGGHLRRSISGRDPLAMQYLSSICVRVTSIGMTRCLLFLAWRIRMVPLWKFISLTLAASGSPSRNPHPRSIRSSIQNSMSV